MVLVHPHVPPPFLHLHTVVLLLNHTQITVFACRYSKTLLSNFWFIPSKSCLS
jgi:hypothetical protein